MKKRLALCNLFDLIIKDSTNPPKFIDRRKKQEAEAFVVMASLLTELLNFIRDDFMTEKEVYKVLINWFEISLGFESIENLPLYLTCVDYIDKRINSYMKIAEQTEEYEILSNLKKFNDLRNKDFFNE